MRFNKEEKKGRKRRKGRARCKPDLEPAVERYFKKAQPMFKLPIYWFLSVIKRSWRRAVGGVGVAAAGCAWWLAGAGRCSLLTPIISKHTFT